MDHRSPIACNDTLLFKSFFSLVGLVDMPMISGFLARGEPNHLRTLQGLIFPTFLYQTIH